jgi:hypothetical protein
MTAPGFLLVISRPDPVGEVAAGAVGRAVGCLVLWVAALRRWQLLVAVAAAPGRGSAPVRACLLVSASDAKAVWALAASCPLPVGGEITVLPVCEVASHA